LVKDTEGELLSFYQLRGKKVPEGVDMLAFYKQMLYGTLQTAR